MVGVNIIPIMCGSGTVKQEIATICSDICVSISYEFTLVRKYSTITEGEFTEIVIRYGSLIGVISDEIVGTKSVYIYFVEYNTTCSATDSLLFCYGILIGINIEYSF